MTSPLPPGVRRIDPDAEAARLAAARKGEPGVWFVRIDFPDGSFRKVAISDLLVKSAAMRPVARGASAGVIDQVTVLRMAENEIWREG